MKLVIDKFSFNSNEVLFSDLELNIKEKQKLAIFGSNGCGKSTLLNILVGKLKSSARIENTISMAYFGKQSNINPYSSLQIEKELFKDNLDLELYNELLKGLNFENYEKRKVYKLSQGNVLKAELIFILSLKNKHLFLLDEPSDSLDEKSVAFLANFIKNSNKTFIVVTHDANFADAFLTEKYYLENQKLVKYD